MIFVSYSHRDEAWRKHFETISKPLARAESMRFWSDRDIKAGEWERQIEAAMKEAVAAVLLVSDNFLASDYIVEKELPYLLRAHQSRGLMIVWAYLEPCDIKRYKEITRFQAMTLGDLVPMAKMNPWQWKQTMLQGCDMIDGFLKTLEEPKINRGANGKTFPRISDVQLLAQPARRTVEVLVFALDGKWWRQSPIKPGTKVTKIHLGNDATRKGSKYRIVAMTTERPLTQQTYLSLPDYRTKSSEITLIRG
ncbi:MAG TPA: toll/interleukin-1 receptor domain-containing protein [Candidatus Binataceae bacterium]|nr:toll/interleukin-1 receptor domain-containing protein [Candidatus Binataceae bacterium]